MLGRGRRAAPAPPELAATSREDENGDVGADEGDEDDEDEDDEGDEDDEDEDDEDEEEGQKVFSI